MTTFVIHFSICNLFISFMILFLLVIKKLFKNSLTGRTQYNLWFLPLILMIVPFIPIESDRLFPIFALLKRFGYFATPDATVPFTKNPWTSSEVSDHWLNDFTISVSGQTPSHWGTVLFAIWIAGMLILTIFIIRSLLRLRTVTHSALPLQNKKARTIYKHCLKEMSIEKRIPVYSTAFLKSPVISGIVKPRIYIPIHLLSDSDYEAIRYIFLHELQHYRHKDNFFNIVMIASGIVYWFNPFVWLAIRSMKKDREVACDTAVLNMLDPDCYKAYGYALISFAQKISVTPFPFSSSLSGNIKELKLRILNISTYKKPSIFKRLWNGILLAIVSIVFINSIPVLASNNMTGNYNQRNTPLENALSFDYADLFEGYEGCFVLYDLNHDQWSYYNKDMAVTRRSPDSTYKIYDALFALEENVITPESSVIAWDQTAYPFESWNRDQTLQTAMTDSVNWYFQSLDARIGINIIQKYISHIGYGNENIGNDLSSYWMESNLKISPVEQVELLKNFYMNDFEFSAENIQTVKNSIYLASSSTGSLYGKTGTGRVDGKDINGWFIGFVESSTNTYFFAVNIRSESNATGSAAAEITLSILSSMNIW